MLDQVSSSVVGESKEIDVGKAGNMGKNDLD
jgi:hypothetical protein